MSASKQLFCHECGAKLLPDAKFCGICGAKMRIGVDADSEQIPSTVSPSTPPMDEDKRGFGAIPRQSYPSTPPPSYPGTEIPSQYPQQQAAPPYYIGTPTIWEKPDQRLKNLWRTLISPIKAMQKVARGPDYGVPILMTFIVGFLTGLAYYLYFQLRVTVNWAQITEDQETMWTMWVLYISFGSLILITFLSFFITTFVLHGTIALVGKLAPYERSYKQSFAISGYAQVPNLIFAIISIPIIFLLKEEKTINFSADVTDMDMVEEIQNLLFPWLELQALSLLFFGWSIVIIYFGIKGSFIRQTEIKSVFIVFAIVRTILFIVFV
ncbi:MAG: YIP1 family protein [Candidatus Hodarchaeota archaeon]